VGGIISEWRVASPGISNQPDRYSYRNRFVASAGHADYVDWQLLVGAGLARRWPGALDERRSHHGLETRRKLDPEDFP
jgi:hypothetical protein